MKKRLLISFGIIVAVALTVTAGLYFYMKAQPIKETESSHYDPTKPSNTLSENPSKQEAQTKPDLSKDLGACNVTSVDQINEVLNATTTQAANNRGIAHTKGATAQSCVYSLDTNDDGGNRLTVTITTFDSNNSTAQAQDGYKAFTMIDGLGDSAYFVTGENDPSVTYDLAIFKGQKLIELLITVPKNTNAFTDASAQETLVTLAKQASLPN